MNEFDFYLWVFMRTTGCPSGVEREDALFIYSVTSKVRVGNILKSSLDWLMVNNSSVHHKGSPTWEIFLTNFV